VLETSNAADLPQVAFAGTKVRVARPNRFLAELAHAEPDVASVVDRMPGRFRKPRATRVDPPNIMVNADCGAFAEALAAAWGPALVCLATGILQR
jgi:hypothetical protein